MALLLDLLVTGQTRLNDDTYAKDIYADKFIRTGSSDLYVLLGGGGHKLLSDFSMAHNHPYLPLAGGDMNSGARISGSGGNLYLGNSNNAGWVYVQDMCSQLGSNYWNIAQAGNATFSGTTTSSKFKKEGSSDSYVLLGGGGHKLESNLSVSTANMISHSTYYYNGNVMKNSTSSDTIFGTTATANYLFPSFMESHPLFNNNYADVINFTGYCKWGGTQLATEYNAINPRVAIRKYNQTRSDWGDWTELLSNKNGVRWGGYNTTFESGTPASAVKSRFTASYMPDGNLLTYNTAGTEYTLFMTCRPDILHGSALKWGYPDRYIYILRFINGSAQTTDWEKIAAGYADSAGSSSYYTLGPSSTFTNVWDCNAPDRIVYSEYGSSGRSVSNAPAGWYYGTLLELGHMNYRGQNSSLNLQLMWDVAHNTTNGGTLWFRGNCSTYKWAKNWCKVLTDQNYSSYALPLSGGWMDYAAQIYFKGLNQSTAVYSTIGYRASLGSAMHHASSPHQDNGAFYIGTNGCNSANDWGGLAIDNEGVTVFGAGDTGSVFRVLNEDNVSDGAQFYVTKASGTVSKYTHSISNGLLKVTSNGNTMTIGSQNSGYGHIENSADIPFYFNKTVYVDGAIWRYNTNYGIASDGYFYAKGVYANRDGSSTGGGISLYSNTDPMTYGIAFRGTGTYGTHGYVTAADDWATYLTMNDSTTRGWIFRRYNANVASIAGNGNMAIGQHLKFSNEAHISTNRSTDYHYGYTFNLTANEQSIGMYSGPAGEAGGVVISPDGCLIYNSSDSGYNLQVRDKDLGADLTNIATLTFGIEQSGHYAWSRGGFKKNGSDDSYVLLGGGGHKLESSLSVNYAASAGNADTVDGYHATDLLREFWTSSPGYDGNTHNYSPILTFSYSNNAPYTGVFVDLCSNGYGVMLNTSYYSDTQLAYRRHGTSGDGGMGSWRYLIDNVTIGSQSVNYATSAGNADTVDNLHASSLVKFYLSPMTSNAPADSAKSWFTGTMPSASGAIVYNVPGSEKTIIAGKSSGAHGHMLQLNYDDTYLRILRYKASTWQSTDWEKISAGYADSAGNADTLDGYHHASFAKIADVNNLMHSGNEFTYAAPTYSGDIWHNYRTSSWSTDGGIANYRFGNGAGGYATVVALAFYESSDERLKDFYNTVDVDLDKLSSLPKKFFKWKSKPNGEFEIGTSAQELQKLYPQLVNTDDKGYLTVAYDKLSIIALRAIDKLYEMNKNLERRIQLLESKR